ncbi:MAG: hypothetical protein HQ461_15220 [Deltaproteobacteria bacterium]|nr:hypothetical protein [Deltaproteobacteria bacterium]
MKREHLKFLLVMAVAVAAGLGALLFWLLQNPPAPTVLPAPAPVIAAPSLPPADPFADRQAEAIALVQQSATPRGPLGVGLSDAAILFPGLAAAKPTWSATRVKDGVYEVAWQTQIAGLAVGPRWGVQLDKAALPAGGSAVVAANAYAEIFAAPSLDAWTKAPLPADTLLLSTLLGAAGPKELAISSALLASLRTAAKEGRAVEPLGWSVTLLRSKPPEKPAYSVAYAWKEAGESKFATWEVDLASRAVKPADLSANAVAQAAAATDPKLLAEAFPRDLTRARGNPMRERKLDRRALRFLVAEPLRQQAAAVLVRFPDRNGAAEFGGWTAVESGTPGLFNLTLDVRYGTEIENVVWTSDTATGAVKAVSEAALLIESLVLPAEPARER